MMSQFISSILQGLLPCFIILSLLWVRCPNKNNLYLTLWFSIIGVIIGSIVGGFTPMNKLWIGFLSFFQMISIILFIIGYIFCNKIYKYFLIEIISSLLLLFAAWSWGSLNNTLILSTTNTLDTEFIKNISSCVFVYVLLFLLSITLYSILKKMDKLLIINKIINLLVILFLLIYFFPISGNILLSLAKNGFFDLSSSLVSYVAIATYFPTYIVYLSILIIVVLLIIFYLLIIFPIKSSIVGLSGVEKRKIKANYLKLRNLFIGVLFIISLITICEFYWKNIGSKPFSISDAVEVKVDDDDIIRIPVDEVKDGKLHRFLWISEDGHAIRFLVINKSKKKLNLVAVLDACMLCGDTGYVMDGDKVICVACKVSLFIPSIGNAGGCNPIVLAKDSYKYDDKVLSILATELRYNANYFSTILTIKVKDPVDEKELTNTSAKYQYEIDGKTYYFNSEKNMNIFKDNPSNYIKVKEDNTSFE